LDVYEYVKENKLKGRSAINQVEFRDFFKDIKIKTIVEIGTYKGASTAYIEEILATESEAYGTIEGE